MHVQGDEIRCHHDVTSSAMLIILHRITSHHSSISVELPTSSPGWTSPAREEKKATAPVLDFPFERKRISKYKKKNGSNFKHVDTLLARE